MLQKCFVSSLSQASSQLLRFPAYAALLDDKALEATLPKSERAHGDQILNWCAKVGSVEAALLAAIPSAANLVSFLGMAESTCVKKTRFIPVQLRRILLQLCHVRLRVLLHCPLHFFHSSFTRGLNRQHAVRVPEVPTAAT